MTTDVVACSERLALRRFTKHDITPRYIAWLNDPLVVRYSNQRFRVHDDVSCANYLASFEGTDNLFLAIDYGHERFTIGTMTAYVSANHGTADIGILLGERPHWGKGIGLESWGLLMQFLFDVRLVRKIIAGTLRCNMPMVRIMESSGMELEGTRKRQEIVDGEPQDVLLFAKFRPS